MKTIKNLFVILIALCVSFVLIGCNNEEDIKLYEEVDALIEALPDTVTLDDEDSIKEARDAYEELSNEDKELVENLDKLEKKESDLQDLKNEAEKLKDDQSKASAVIEVINDLPEDVETSDKVEIDAANAAYNALTADQKELVTNKDILVQKVADLELAFNQVEADEIVEMISLLPEVVTLDDKVAIEEIYAAVNSKDEDILELIPNLDEFNSKYEVYLLLVENKDKALEVDNLIDLIPDTITLQDEEKITNARAKFELLNNDQKDLVTKLDKLVAKEAELEELKKPDLTIEQKVELIKEYLIETYGEMEIIDENITLPTRNNEYGGSISWSTTDSKILTSTGEYTAPLYDTLVEMMFTVILRGVRATASIQVPVKGLTPTDTWQVVDTFLNTISKDRISNQKYIMFGFESGYERNDAVNLGYLPFYDGKSSQIITQIVPSTNTSVRSNTIRTSTEYITVHDTASASPSANATMQNNYIYTYSGSSKSWHYTVDDTLIYNHVPVDEVAWHAGDGSREYGVNDSGIAAKPLRNPIVTISDDGYYELDGEKSLVKAPLIGDRLPKTSDITDSGIMVTVGDNDNYLIGNTYYNSGYGVIANAGGNRNSVGIETCVNQGSNYEITMRKTAKLVAELLLRYDLGLDRVRQHNFFSGKDCPQTIRTANRWEEFMDIVEIEYYAKKYLTDVTFEWKSLTPTILSNTGMVVNHPGASTDVNYQVTVTYNGESRVFDFTSTLNPYF